MRLYLIGGVLFGLSTAIFGQQLPFVPVPNSPKNLSVIFQDTHNRLWVAGKGEAACFDGTRFFTLHTLGLPVAETNAISEDSEGGIWIATDAGLYQFDRGRLSRIVTGDAIDVLPITPDVMVVTVAPAGHPADAPTLLSVRRSFEGTWGKPEEITTLPTPGRLTLDHHGSVTFACEKAWCEIPVAALLKGKSPQFTIQRHPFPVPYQGARRVLRDRFGCVWVRGQGNVRYQCPGDPSPTRLPLDLNPIDAGANLWETEDGSIILIGIGTLAIGRPGTFRTVKPMHGLPDVASVLIGKDGTIWLGGSTGLYRLAYPFRLEFWTQRDGLESPQSVLQLSGKTFVASGPGISVLSEDRAHWVALQGTQELGILLHLVPGPQNTIVAAAYQNAVAQFTLAGKMIARTMPGRAAGGQKLARTPDGQLWMAGAGVVRVDKIGGQLRSTIEDLPNPNNSLDIEFQPATGTLWASYAGGLAARSDGKWRFITKKDGLLENDLISLAAHPNGDVWVGYQNIKAFARVRPESEGHADVRQFHGGPETGNPETTFFDVDARGWLWRGSPTGIFVADIQHAEGGVWLPLNEMDGLPAVSANQQSFYSDPDGSVWFGADNTLIHFSPPDDLLQPVQRPDVFVSGFSWDGTPRLAEAVGGGVPYGKSLVADVGSLRFASRNGLRLRYRLPPKQRDWQETSSAELNLGTPSWGVHTVEIQAKMGNGSWYDVARQQFTVLRPLWFSWPIASLLTLGGGAAALGAYARRKRRRELARKLLPDVTPWRDAAFAGTDHPLSGSLLDSRYEVGAIIARGGFALILAGRDRSHNSRPCAIKIFRPGILDEEWITKRFRQEVSALEQVEHPNVVRILGDGISSDGEPYLVMEYIEGQTLRTALQQGAMPPRQVANLLRQAGGALDAIHARGIFHRDIKPENMMLRSEAESGAELVIIDFSIALVKDRDRTIHELSRAGGTLDYMPPEQPQGHAEPASDIYSLAKVVVEMLTGLPVRKLLPAAAMDLPQQIRHVLVERSFGLSAASLDLMSAALEFHPASRPKSAGLFATFIAEDLERLNPDNVS